MSDIHRDRQRDAAGIGPYARDAERLVRLSDLGKWDVAEGEPDIRGWEVRTIGGRELGKVKELLVDPDDPRCRYIEYEVMINGKPGLAEVHVCDYGEPGTNDLFAIKLSTGYLASGHIVGGGDIQLHRGDCK